jgi:hypothetical protein
VFTDQYYRVAYKIQKLKLKIQKKKEKKKKKEKRKKKKEKRKWKFGGISSYDADRGIGFTAL